MNLGLKKENEPQPAIDTLCDNCGAIYDLLDCSTSLFGNILCPDCSTETVTGSRTEEEQHRHEYFIVPNYTHSKSKYLGR